MFPKFVVVWYEENIDTFNHVFAVDENELSFILRSLRKDESVVKIGWYALHSSEKRFYTWRT